MAMHTWIDKTADNNKGREPNGNDTTESQRRWHSREPKEGELIILLM